MSSEENDHYAKFIAENQGVVDICSYQNIYQSSYHSF